MTKFIEFKTNKLGRVVVNVNDIFLSKEGNVVKTDYYVCLRGSDHIWSVTWEEYVRLRKLLLELEK